jgi:hypothetical protein
VTRGPLVEIADVSASELDPEQLLEAGIEAPSSSSESATYGFELRGWAVGRRVPVSSVELVHPGVRRRRVSLELRRADLAVAHPGLGWAESSGFEAQINALRLPTDFRVSVDAVLADGDRATIGTICGTRSPLRSGFESQLDPLVVTTLGRTGTTLLMQLLHAHPAIVVYRPFEHEPRAMGYWLDLLTALADPESYKRQLVPPIERKEGWWLGADSPLVGKEIPDAEIERWVGVGAVEATAEFCQRQIEAVYQRIASMSGSDPAYFAEKYGPGWLPPFAWELYPAAREVIVVRDFRDVLCSILAFNSKRGFDSFGRQRAETDQQFVTFFGERVDDLLEAWRRRRGNAHLLRYEDLVLHPAETLDRLLAYLGLERGEKTITSMLGTLAQTSPRMEMHRTTPEAEASIGRWRRDLDPDLQRASEETFRPALEEFGYLSEAAPAAAG